MIKLQMAKLWITALLVALCVAVLQTENCVQNVLQATQFSVTAGNISEDFLVSLLPPPLKKHLKPAFL